MATGGTGNGLSVTYYNNIDFTGTTVTGVDPTVDFAWGAGSPSAAIANDTFSARWTGQVEAQFTGTYTFYTVSDDGVRLWVNGQQIINNWTDHAPTENSGTIALTAGQRYDIRMEFYENGGGATARLLWSSASVPKAVVPSTRLYPQPPRRARSGSTSSRRRRRCPPGISPTAGWSTPLEATARRMAGTPITRPRREIATPPTRPTSATTRSTHLQKPAVPDAVWEIAVPNGTYVVRVVSGDASNFDSVFRTTVEGVLTVTGTPTTSTRWIEGTSTVTVTDGRLTIRSGAGASNNKICFVEITQS